MLISSSFVVLASLISQVGTLSLFSVSFSLVFLFGICFLPLMVSMGEHLSSSQVGTLMLDEVSMLLCYITLLVLFLSFYSHPFEEYSLPVLVFVLLFISSYMVFSSSSLFLLYLFYEASLVPISYAILKWGSYSDRASSALIMLLFTSFFTFPFTLVMFSIFFESGSFMFLVHGLIPSQSIPPFFAYWILFSFAVKLPLYGVHFWLPMAHVEAPTFGSMVLAGLLLKMGGCGLLRLTPYMESSLFTISSSMLSYLILAIVFSALVTCVQSDFKRLVAYSSVVHMTLVVMLVITPSILSKKAILMLMVFHGMTSPLLFYFVGVIYFLFGTRLIYLLRGLLLSAPLLSLGATLIFILSVPVPPSTPFLGEVLIFMSVFPVSSWMVMVILLSLFLVLVYNMLWFVGVSFDSPCVSLTFSSILNSLILFSFILPTFLFVFLTPLF